MSAGRSATVAERLAEAAMLLEDITDTPRLDVELLMAHAMNVTRPQLLARGPQIAHTTDFDALLEQRLRRAPIAYILGEWEFYSLPLRITPPILVPRPETEHLVECVLDHIGTKSAHVLDLCTGSGCVAIAIAVNAPHARVQAVDIAPEAVQLASVNIHLHSLEDRVQVIQGDLDATLGPDAVEWDVICANPPYVCDDEYATLPPDIRLYEDSRALLGGSDGLDIVRRIIGIGSMRLREGGLLAMELAEDQYDEVAALMREAGFGAIHPVHDLAGVQRIAAGLLTVTGRNA